MASPHTIATKDPAAVAAHAKAVFAACDWPSSHPLLDRLFADVTALFTGTWPGYRAIDMRYHDFEHTLQATVCFLDLLRGRQRAPEIPLLRQRDAELGVMAVLLHDTGYLRPTDDDQGTGAKFTLVHVQRSCDFARAYLPRLAITTPELADICAAIGSTGPRNRISTQNFRRPEARTLACMLVTADYLGQMSAPDYPDELDFLYGEFLEAWEFDRAPVEQRPFRSAADLKSKTPDFWEKVVRPMLDTEAERMHRHLLVTGQPNRYLQAVEANIAEIRQRASA
ncbi:MAG: HD domain-containing protein [Candidatus Didemnitutus sp.]|nr:HD domain-containing protein [Candidatus Didemnitutus sp.]